MYIKNHFCIPAYENGVLKYFGIYCLYQICLQLTDKGFLFTIPGKDVHCHYCKTLIFSLEEKNQIVNLAKIGGLAVAIKYIEGIKYNVKK